MMKITSKTSITSTSGVVLISAIGSALLPLSMVQNDMAISC